MLNRYETGPIATVLVIVTALALCAFDIFDALRFHHKMGWLNAEGTLLILVVFHQRFRHHKD